MFAHQARQNWRQFLMRLIEEPLAAIDLMKRLIPNDGSGNTSGNTTREPVHGPTLKRTSTPANPTLGQSGRPGVGWPAWSARISGWAGPAWSARISG
jgi:hypothetical protein